MTKIRSGLAERAGIAQAPGMMNLDAARKRLESLQSVTLGHLPTPIDELLRLRATIGLKALLLAKRDDALSFGFGGNKVRKLTLVAARALAEGADTLITCGGVQSNHCRATAAAAAKLGLGCHIVVNGAKPDRLTGNAQLVNLFGAAVTYVGTRDERAPAMEQLATDLRAGGTQPFVIPLGATTPGRPGCHAGPHRPRHLVRRDAGRVAGRMRALLTAHARDRGQRR
jgi:1-aminocyclopropane-1-carboxylate deaminase/D-cysteine desulfhydrase-like pyridoxal-dependent ACC family enzyme